jgi:iron-sulfur cluster assembly accessory protein
MTMSAATTETQTEIPVQVTEAAAIQIRDMLSKEKDSAGKGLRVFVEAGGCSGMQYGMVFDEKRADDLAREFFGVPVLVDPFSANYLLGNFWGRRLLKRKDVRKTSWAGNRELDKDAGLRRVEGMLFGVAPR